MLIPVGNRGYTSNSKQDFYQLVQYSPCTNLGKIVSYMIKSKMQNRSFQTIAEATVEETIKAMVLSGQGIAWLPAEYISKEIADFTLRQIDDLESIEVNINIYRYRNSLNGRSNTWQKLIDDCSL